MFALRQYVKCARNIVRSCQTKFISSASPLVNISLDDDGTATVTMQRYSANALNLEMLQNLTKALDEVERNKCKGIILTSSLSSVFSAGLDLNELYKPDIKRVETFWMTLQDFWIKLIGSSFITAAAVNGHAPAGGCVLAMACEYRVMVSGKYTIGLNEVKLGIVMYKWLIDMTSHILTQRQAELAITTGTMFSVDEALKVGFIDEIAADKEDAIDKCKEFIKKFDKVPSQTRVLTKRRVREGPLTLLQGNRTQDTQEFLQTITSPQVQESLAVYVQEMKLRKEAPKNTIN